MKKKICDRIKKAAANLLTLTVAVSLLALPVFAETETAESTAESGVADGGAPDGGMADGSYADEAGWVNFMLICNEGMSSRGGNSGNTEMVVSLNRNTGRIRLMMFSWDTFVNYEEYDVPQKLDMAYRNGGPEEAVKVFNDNFNTDIDLFLSLNYLNLAALIDNYGGVDVDVTRAERNALNSMVSSKKEDLQKQLEDHKLDQLAIDVLADEYYLQEFGPGTHLNGLQAVGYGWLQYDSVYNCCLREQDVIANLFHHVGETLHETIVFYTNESGKPDIDDGRRLINLDDIQPDDMDFLREEIDPIFDDSYNNLTDPDINSITLALARVSYLASRQGVELMDHMDYTVMPLEVKEPYQTVAGIKGHVIDFEANSAAIHNFLYTEA